MESILILLMTMGMLLYFFQRIWINRDFLSKYISTVGGKKASIIHPKPIFLIPFIAFHSVLAIFVGYLIYTNESEGKTIFRLLLSSIVAMIFLFLLFISYFIITIMIKEIIYMKDMTINLILTYSLVSGMILLKQVFTNNIEYPKRFPMD